MPDEKKKPLHPETNFLPPLDMVLSFFKKKDKPDANSVADEAEEVQGHAVKRIINHITHDEQQPTDQKTID
jgi:hypothetical protein